MWIDAREAILVRLAAGHPSVERIESDVPANRRSTGHVRHDPLTRHGGGGDVVHDAGDRRRIDRLDRFVNGIADRLAVDDDIVLVGPGTVPGQLQARLDELDTHHQRTRSISVRRSAPQTDRQLIAQLREHVGVSPKRRQVGRSDAAD